jgi:lipoprotein-anchoring transpeptidase ErfK/SrfK
MGKDRAPFHGVRAARPGRRGRMAAALAGAGLGAVFLVAVLGPASPTPAPTASEPGRYPRVKGVPRPVTPAFTVPDPDPLLEGKHRTAWAPVSQPVAARLLPDAGSPTVAQLNPRTPEGTANIVVALRRRADPVGELWVEVMLPVLPNGTTGWVPRAALGGYGTVRTELVVDLSDLEATLFRSGRAVFSSEVGVGKPLWPTPTGRFYVRNKLVGFDDPFYGPVAFGTSARSAVLTDWPAGGFVGIHGTNRPDLLPGRVSHGCVRMRNDDILTLSRLMPVGTPLRIRR